MNQIVLKDISFVYKNEEEFSLRNLNLDFKQGEFVSILGPNGSGKSTLLKLIAGNLKPQKGAINFNGNEYKKIKIKDLAKLIAFVPQSSNPVFQFSIFEIVMMGRTPYLNMFGFENEDDVKIVNEALELVELTHLKDHGINEVSGGEAQRAFIARAIVQQPKVILLDEPSSHLDIKHQLSIFNLIKKLNKEKGLTVILVSHDLNLSGLYSDRIILMKQGKIFFDGNVILSLTEENIRSVFGVDSKVKINENNYSVNVTIKPFLN